ncbi:MAG: hypothetical protein WCY30_03365 [Candidatus Neomarinimicrobiota bacterium]|jgi:hypothetical protein
MVASDLIREFIRKTNDENKPPTVFISRKWYEALLVELVLDPNEQHEIRIDGTLIKSEDDSALSKLINGKTNTGWEVKSPT